MVVAPSFRQVPAVPQVVPSSLRLVPEGQQVVPILRPVLVERVVVPSRSLLERFVPNLHRVPAELELERMEGEEADERELRSRRIAANRDALAEGTRWISSTNTVFDGTYRHMFRAAKARDRG
jgi:hypothetical protein